MFKRKPHPVRTAETVRPLWQVGLHPVAVAKIERVLADAKVELALAELHGDTELADQLETLFIELPVLTWKD